PCSASAIDQRIDASSHGIRPSSRTLAAKNHMSASRNQFLPPAAPDQPMDEGARCVGLARDHENVRGERTTCDEERPPSDGLPARAPGRQWQASERTADVPTVDEAGPKHGCEDAGIDD